MILPTTYEALKAELDHWKYLVSTGPIDKIGPQHSPLCAVHNPEPHELAQPGDCVGCPIRSETQKTYCAGTPLWRLRQHMGPLTVQEWLDYAVAQVQFLQGLVDRAEADAPAEDWTPGSVHRDHIRHALGLTGRSTGSGRNHYCTGPGTTDFLEWLELCAHGYANRAGPRPGFPDHVFVVTGKGRRWLKEAVEATS